jgi:hypothetical protein
MRISSRFTLLVMATLALSMPSPATAQWRKNGKPVPDEPWRVSHGSFKAMLIVTDEPENFLTAWDRPTEAFQMPGFEPHRNMVARRGKFIGIFVIFTGCKNDAQGHCNAELNIEVVKPDGYMYSTMTGDELWIGKPAPSNLQLGPRYMKISIDPGDPAGTYKVKAYARDRISGTMLALQSQFDIPDTEAITSYRAR